MVVGKHYLKKKKDFFFLKYFFWLKERRISTGGRSHGWKVFRGLVAYNRWFFFLVNWIYGIWNTTALIQTLFKAPKLNHTLGFSFYYDIGIFSLLQMENSHEVNKFITHDTILKDGFTKGNSVLLRNAKIGLVLFCVQWQFNWSAIFAWAAGCYVKIFKISNEKIFIQLPSLTLYSLSVGSAGTVGLSSKHYFLWMTKAGDARHIFWTPKVRGIAMNPVDHPHGGRTNKGRHPTNPSGKLAKGVKTRKPRGWSQRKIFSPKMKLL